MPWSRHSYGDYAQRSCCHGRGSPADRRQRTLPSTSNLRTSCRYRNHEAQAYSSSTSKSPVALILIYCTDTFAQNKVDLIREQQAEEHHQSILSFVKGTVADSAPIIPISAQLRYNIDALVEYIVTKIPVPVRDFTTAPKLIVIRSFDVNKPGAEVHELKGGVAGGSLLKGVLRVHRIPFNSL